MEAPSLQLFETTQTAAPQKAHQEVERYKVIEQASQHVYEDLDKACMKHTEHQADFCVEFNQAITIGDHGVQVKLNMAHTRLTLAGSVWFYKGWML